MGLKRAMSFALVLLLVLICAAGCKPKEDVSEDPEIPSIAYEFKEEDKNLEGFITPGIVGVSEVPMSTSYSNFLIERARILKSLTEKMSQNFAEVDDWVFGIMADVSNSDLSLDPLKNIVNAEASEDGKFSGLMGAKEVDVTVTKNENRSASFVMVYTENGMEYEGSGEYDFVSDTMTASVRVKGGEEIMFFDVGHVGTGLEAGYVSQLYYKDYDDTYSVVRCVFVGEDSAFGKESNVKSLPESIYKKPPSGFDFVKSDGVYVIYKDGELISGLNGQEKSYRKEVSSVSETMVSE